MEDGQVILARLTGITAALATVRTLDALAKAIHDVVEQTVFVEYSGVYMTDFTTDALRLWQAKGFGPEEQREAERTAWDRHPGWVIRNKQMLHIPDTDADSRSKDSKRTFHIRSRLWLPIMVDDRAIGAMGMASTRLNAFSQDDVTVLQYASTTSGFMYKNLQDNWVLEQQFVVAERQRQELVALSSPLVEVWNGIIVLPIIGQVGEERAQRMTEKLLAMVAARNIRAVILDMTGVASIDSASIEYLGRMHHAVRLLGSNCVFTGVSSTTATLITKMGVDLGNWMTFATVRQALGRLSGKSAMALGHGSTKKEGSPNERKKGLA